MKYRLYFLANGEVMLCLQGRRCLVRESQPVRYTYHFILALRRSRCASVVADCPVDLETTGNVLSCLNTGRRDSTHPVKPETSRSEPIGLWFQCRSATSRFMHCTQSAVFAVFGGGLLALAIFASASARFLGFVFSALRADFLRYSSRRMLASVGQNVHMTE